MSDIIIAVSRGTDSATFRRRTKMNARQPFLKANLVSFAISLCAVAPALGQVNSQTEPPKIIRKSGGVFQSSAISRVEPTYPPLAKAAQVSGAVVVEVTVDEQGDVVAARAISGHPLLKDAAIAAARGWKFSPTQLSGVPVKVIGTITFNFNLGNKPPNSVDESTKTDKPVVDDIEEARKALNANAYSAEAHFKLADAYADEDLYKEAIEPYQRAIELKPDYKEAYEGLASAYKELSRYDEEILTYKRALEVLPDAVDLFEKLSASLTDQKRYAEAVEVQKRLVQLEPEDAEARFDLGYLLHTLRRYEEAINAYAEALRLRPNYATAHYNIGMAYSALHRYDDALAAYSQALNVKPAYQPLHKLYFDIALAYLQLKRYDEAAANGNQALQLKPDYADVYTYVLSRIYHDTGRYEEAAQALSKASQLNPDDCTALLALGDVYGHLHRFEEAETTVRKVLRINPELGQAHLLLAHALFAQKKMAEAEAALKRGIDLAPNDANGQLLLGSVLAHNGQRAEAEAAYRHVLQLDPNNPLALNNVGYSMVERNENLPQALQMIQRAVNAEPGNGYYLDSLGWAYFKLGNIDEAERYLTEAARIVTSSPGIQEHLGDLYQRRNKTQEARAAWQKGLSLSSDATQLARLKSKLAVTTKK
jgi:TonB family protein